MHTDRKTISVSVALLAVFSAHPAALADSGARDYTLSELADLVRAQQNISLHLSTYVTKQLSNRVPICDTRYVPTQAQLSEYQAIIAGGQKRIKFPVFVNNDAFFFTDSDPAVSAVGEQQIVQNSLAALSAVFRMDRNLADLVLSSLDTRANDGDKTYSASFEQRYQNLPIFGSLIKVIGHSDKEPDYIHGKYYQDVVPTNHVSREPDEVEDSMAALFGPKNVGLKNRMTLYLLPFGCSFIYVYSMTIGFPDNDVKASVLVDAQTGDMVLMRPANIHANAAGYAYRQDPYHTPTYTPRIFPIAGGTQNTSVCGRLRQFYLKSFADLYSGDNGGVFTVSADCILNDPDNGQVCNMMTYRSTRHAYKCLFGSSTDVPLLWPPDDLRFSEVNVHYHFTALKTFFGQYEPYAVPIEKPMTLCKPTDEDCPNVTPIELNLYGVVDTLVCQPGVPPQCTPNNAAAVPMVDYNEDGTFKDPPDWRIFFGYGAANPMLSNTEADGLLDTAKDATIVAHEYGHIRNFRNIIDGRGRSDNDNVIFYLSQPVNEGLADFYSMTYNDLRIVGLWAGAFRNKFKPDAVSGDTLVFNTHSKTDFENWDSVTGNVPRRIDNADIFPDIMYREADSKKPYSGGQVLNRSLFLSLNKIGQDNVMKIALEAVRLVPEGSAFDCYFFGGEWFCRPEDVHTSMVNYMRNLVHATKEIAPWRVNTILASFAEGGLMLDDADASVDTDLVVHRNDPPIFTIYTGENYSFYGDGDATHESNNCNTHFALNLANDSRFTKNPVSIFGELAPGIERDKCTKQIWLGKEQYGDDWDRLKNGSRLFYRLITLKPGTPEEPAGRDIRYSIVPGGLFAVNPGYADIDSSIQCSLFRVDESSEGGSASSYLGFLMVLYYCWRRRRSHEN